METEKKQTAVEWLKEQYRLRGDALPSGIFQEALEMEKDQRKEVYDNGYANGQMDLITQ